MLEDSCEAAGAVDSEGVRVGARGNLATFAFYANKQLTTGEGGMIVPSSPEVAERLRSERNQGRAQDMGWVAHERLGFNYRLTELQAAIGIAQLERADRLLGGARPGGLPVQGAPGVAGRSAGGRGRPRGAGAAVSRPRLMSGAAGSSTRPAPRRGPIVTRWSPSSAGRESRRRPTCRASPSCRTTASGSASRRDSSRSPRTPRRACWRCRSSARWARSRWSGSCCAAARATPGARGGRSDPPGLGHPAHGAPDALLPGRELDPELGSRPASCRRAPARGGR